MRLAALVENTSCRADCGRVHGLSLYLETPQHRLLFDMGPNALFLENAEKLGVEIASVDTAVLSHGHYDHGGGLALFLKRNDRASVYVHEAAFGPYYAAGPASERYIGLETRLEKSPRLVPCRGVTRIDSELTLFSDLPTHDLAPLSNASLRVKENDAYPPDPFRHEQDLLVTAEGKAVLFGGCAHGGIVNILRAAEALLGRAPDAVVSGFHLTNPGLGTDEPAARVRELGAELLRREHTRYYTGHCTGQGPFAILKEQLGARMTYLPGGSVLEL